MEEPLRGKPFVQRKPGGDPGVWYPDLVLVCLLFFFFFFNHWPDPKDIGQQKASINPTSGESGEPTSRRILRTQQVREDTAG